MADNDICLVIKEVDMPSELKLFTIEVAKYVFRLALKEEDFAFYLQSLFNRKFGPMWTCIAGNNFFATVSYENRRFIYFYMGQLGVLLFQKGTVLHDVLLYRMWLGTVLEERAVAREAREEQRRAEEEEGNEEEKKKSLCLLGDVRRKVCRNTKVEEICMKDKTGRMKAKLSDDMLTSKFKL